MKTIKLNVIDWKDYDDIDDFEDEEDDENHYFIETYGRTQDDKSVFLRITGFTPYFFVEVPTNWKNRHLEMFVDFRFRLLMMMSKNFHIV